MSPETLSARVSRLGGSLGAAGEGGGGLLVSSTGPSDATVIRTVQALGYAGLADLKQALVASLERGATPADNMRRTLEDLGQDATLALDMVLETHAEALTALRSAAFREQLGRALPVLHAAERIVVFGI